MSRPKGCKDRDPGAKERRQAGAEKRWGDQKRRDEQRSRLKQQWSDPEWAAMQAKRIKAGVWASDKVGGGGAHQERPERQPYRPGIDPRPDFTKGRAR